MPRAPMSPAMRHLIQNHPGKVHILTAALQSGLVVRVIMEDGEEHIMGLTGKKDIEPEDIVVIDLK